MPGGPSIPRGQQAASSTAGKAATAAISSIGGGGGRPAGCMSITIDGKRVPLTPESVRRAKARREHQGD